MTTMSTTMTAKRTSGKPFPVLAAAAAVILLTAAAVHAQEGPTVSGDGTATIERQPELMRMQVEIRAEGKTLKEALAKLEQRRGEVRKKLAELGAAERSVKFGNPSLGGRQNRQQMMEMMVRARMREGRQQPKPQTPQSVKVTTSVTAEWPLKGGDPDASLLESHALREKIQAADLGDMKQASLQQQEEAEEARIEEDFDEDGEPAPGQPVFFFVARLSEEDRAKATAGAYEQARRRAEQLARAAGRQLGGIRQLRTQSTPDVGEYDPYGGAFQQYMYGMYQRSGQGAADLEEAIGPEPGPVSTRVSVSASFELK